MSHAFFHSLIFLNFLYPCVLEVSPLNNIYIFSTAYKFCFLTVEGSHLFLESSHLYLLWLPLFGLISNILFCTFCLSSFHTFDLNWTIPFDSYLYPWSSASFFSSHTRSYSFHSCLLKIYKLYELLPIWCTEFSFTRNLLTTFPSSSW